MTERMTEEQTLAAEQDLFDQQAARTPENTTESTEAPPIEQPQDDVDMAVKLTQELEAGFKIKDRSSGEQLVITIDEARKLIANPTASGIEPSDKEIILFLKICQARGLNPYVGDAYLVGYDNYAKKGEKKTASFQTIVAYQALIKRAENHTSYDGMESGVTVWDRKNGVKLDLEGDVYYKGDENEMVLIGGWCKVYRKDKSKPEYATARLSAYKKTKDVWENGRKTDKKTASGYWATDESWMICKCARSKALKSAFPNELGGMIIDAELGMRQNAEEAEVKGRVRIGQDQEGSAADKL